MATAAFVLSRDVISLSKGHEYFGCSDALKIVLGVRSRRPGRLFVYARQPLASNNVTVLRELVCVRSQSYTLVIRTCEIYFHLAVVGRA
jgi:hypothetical protein